MGVMGPPPGGRAPSLSRRGSSGSRPAETRSSIVTAFSLSRVVTSIVTHTRVPLSTSCNGSPTHSPVVSSRLCTTLRTSRPLYVGASSRSAGMNSIWTATWALPVPDTSKLILCIPPNSSVSFSSSAVEGEDGRERSSQAEENTRGPRSSSVKRKVVRSLLVSPETPAGEGLPSPSPSVPLTSLAVSVMSGSSLPVLSSRDLRDATERIMEAGAGGGTLELL
mmetsp:Transcript_12809/g.25006  ORF Transcript_12809/g.25006 Transcript_12809/m.25006 type:complete len:222 (-) Transcript_12809:3649-4314(-)